MGPNYWHPDLLDVTIPKIGENMADFFLTEYQTQKHFFRLKLYGYFIFNDSRAPTGIIENMRVGKLRKSKEKWK